MRNHNRFSALALIKTIIFLGAGIAVLAFLAWILFPNSPARMIIGKTEIFLEIADTEESRITGLSLRESLPQDTGLLFVFEKETFPGIWMKDMNFPIDIIWINESNHIVHIEKEVSPESYPKIFIPPALALYVLETNSGFVEKNEVSVGDEVQFLYRK